MLYDVIKHNVMTNVAPWCSGYHYYTTSFTKAQVQILLAASRRFAMVKISDNDPGWHKAKRLSSVNHTTKTIHHYHHHHHHHRRY